MQNDAVTLTEAGSGRVIGDKQSSLQSAGSSTARYLLDPAISRFTVRAFATGLLAALGHSPTIAIRDFEGEVRLQAGSLEGASLRMRIRADSLTVQDRISDKDRREMERQMKEIVLETDRFPDIVCECSSVSEGNGGTVVLNSKLTLHGVTRSQPVAARVVVTGDLLRGFGEFSILQTDYNIRLVTALAGGLKLKDELKFLFDIAARKQE